MAKHFPDFLGLALHLSQKDRAPGSVFPFSDTKMRNTEPGALLLLEPPSGKRRKVLE